MRNNVQQIRISKEMTQSQLAALMGVQVQTISNIERARHVPRPITLRKLARALEVSVDDLFPGEEAA